MKVEQKHKQAMQAKVKEVIALKQQIGELKAKLEALQRIITRQEHIIDAMTRVTATTTPIPDLGDTTPFHTPILKGSDQSQTSDLIE